MEAFDLYYKQGDRDYIGGNISQLSHATQCAMLAEKDFPDNKEFIVACFLHDIGHLVALEKNLETNNLGCPNHNIIGSEYLKNLGFSDLIVQCCKLHAKTKRYLVTVNKDYMDKLSEASKKTLMSQGGKMDYYHVRAFEINPLSKYLIQMRYYDDLAKNNSQEMEEFLASKDWIRHYKTEYLNINNNRKNVCMGTVSRGFSY